MVLKKIGSMDNDDFLKEDKTKNESEKNFEKTDHIPVSQEGKSTVENTTSSIIGYKNKLKKKKGMKSNQKNQTDINAKVSQVIFAIAELVKPDEEFFTTDINDVLRQKGFSNSDISGQLYALKKNGTLSNRLPETDEEKELFHKNVRIWTTSDKFWIRHEKLINEKKRQETDSNKIDDLSDDE